MTLKDWQARWGHHVPAQAIAELTAILSPVMPSPSPTARHSEAAGRHRYVSRRAGPVCQSGAITTEDALTSRAG